MATLENVRFEFYRGRTYTRDFTVVGDIDVSNIYFSVCENPNNKHYCLGKSLNKGITIVDKGTNEEGKPYTKYNLTIEATDTEHMKFDYDYGFDIALISNKKKIQLITGIMYLKENYTKSCNECLGR